MASATAPGSRWQRALAHLARIRYRLLLVNVLVVGVPLGGVALGRIVERELSTALEQDMIHQAQLVRAMVSHDPGGPRLAERGPMLAAAARDTRTRIRLVDAAGKVVADSHAAGPPEGAEVPAVDTLRRTEPYHVAEVPDPVDVASRREIQTALAGGYGSATRLWRNQERVYFFSALPVAVDDRVVGAVYVTRSTQPVKVQLYRLRTWLFQVLAAALGVTAVLTLFLAATIERPLTRLGRIAGRIAGGSRTERLALERKDEIGELARAVDRMAQELDRRAADMRDLAADISHEFKSPLTGIRGAAELLRDGADDDPAARARFLTMILDDAARLDRLVSRLLELSRAEADASPVETVDLVALARDAAARAAGPVDIVADGAVAVVGRRRGLASAIENLVDNAVQHAAAGTPVTVRISADADQVRIAVHNRGAPMSAAVQARVWDRFFTTRAASGGTGLGLAIVRSVVATHGGRVELVSTAADGTTFSIALPRA
jgi:two-component system sensor histidine kinase ChvG